MFSLLFDALLAAIVFLAVLAVYSRDLLKSVIFLSASGACTAAAFFLLNAPDIAITKAAVEAGLSTMIFIVAVQKTARFEKDRGEMNNGKNSVLPGPSKKISSVIEKQEKSK